MLDRLYGALRGIDVPAELRAATEPAAAVVAALEDDLNTPKAFAEMFNIARTLNKTTNDNERVRLAAQLYACGDLTGLINADPETWFAGDDAGELSGAQIEVLLDQRETARAARDFVAADGIRDQLKAAGISIEDGAGGTRWRRSD
jgi:cysteinyl-tRNA synthetase